MNTAIIKSKIRRYALWFVRNFYSKPKSIILLIKNRSKYCSNPSYFPELTRKSRLRILRDQIIQCIKFVYPNEFYFPYGFDVKTSREMNEYLHYGPFSIIRDTNNCKPHSGTAILRNKLYFSFFAGALGINAGNNKGVIKGNITFVPEEQSDISTYTFLQSLSGDFIFKPVDGECGNEIHLLKALDGMFWENSVSLTYDELLEKLQTDNWLVQEVVKQHPVLASLHPQSLNTMRLVTIRDINNGEIKTFPSILRIGTGDSVVDNTSQGGIAVAVDLQTGKLSKYGYYKPGYGTRTEIHPDTGIRFFEFTIPYFEEAKKQALKLHAMLPTVQSIGWDIAIGENGPIFIEGNDNWEINGPQICNGPLKNLFYQLSIKR